MLNQKKLLKRRQANIRANLIEVVHLDATITSIALFKLENEDMGTSHFI